jgi:hypothetical protein
MTYGFIYRCDHDDCDIQTDPERPGFSMTNYPPSGWFSLTRTGDMGTLHFHSAACLYEYFRDMLAMPESTLHVDMAGPDLSVPVTAGFKRAIVDRPQA